MARKPTDIAMMKVSVKPGSAKKDNAAPRYDEAVSADVDDVRPELEGLTQNELVDLVLQIAGQYMQPDELKDMIAGLSPTGEEAPDEMGGGMPGGMGGGMPQGMI